MVVLHQKCNVAHHTVALFQSTRYDTSIHPYLRMSPGPGMVRQQGEHQLLADLISQMLMVTAIT